MESESGRRLPAEVWALIGALAGAIGTFGGYHLAAALAPGLGRGITIIETLVLAHGAPFCVIAYWSDPQRERRLESAWSAAAFVFIGMAVYHAGFWLWLFSWIYA